MVTHVIQSIMLTHCILSFKWIFEFYHFCSTLGCLFNKILALIVLDLVREARDRLDIKVFNDL
jgi:hypothetical protein